MLLLHESTSAGGDLGPDEIQAIIARYVAWSARMREEGRLMGGEKLRDDGGKVLVCRGEGVVVRDGPYAETKEVIGGYYTLLADDYEDAIRLARTCPHLELGGTIEVCEVEPVSSAADA